LIYFECEQGCDPLPPLAVAQHKGHTYTGWVR
jgi:hypothetical protein